MLNADKPQLWKRDIERQRLLNSIQNKKTKAQKNKAGQFETPRGLALEITKFALRCASFGGNKVSFLEPALGTGAFLSALFESVPSAKISSALGVEIDKEVANIANHLWKSEGLNLICGDFTCIEPPSSEEGRVNLIVTNPPYVRHHHISGKDKRRLKNLVMDNLGMDVSGLSGLYCYFVLLSHMWLKENGLGVWLIPSEYLTVNYGSSLRKYLTEHVRPIRIHSFEYEDLKFDDALVSSSVLIYKKSKVKPNDEVTISRGDSLQKPAFTNKVSVAVLKTSEKWTGFFSSSSAASPDSLGYPRLSDFFRIQRGIATGANEFFIMPRGRARGLGIPNRFLKPILPGPRYIKTLTIEAEPDGFPAIGDQSVVIDCDADEGVVAKEHPDFAAYLKTAKEAGIRDRYLVRKRIPWYKQEQREPAPFLCTYMGRKCGDRQLFRFIRNKSKAVCTNVYLLLYPIAELRDALLHEPELASSVLDALNNLEMHGFITNGRAYGGGLYKIEPKELGRLPAKSLDDWKTGARECMITLNQTVQTHGCSPAIHLRNRTLTRA